MDAAKQASPDDRPEAGADGWTDDALREAQAAERPKVVIDPAHQPSWAAQQFYKFANTAFSSATVAFLRTLANPPKPAGPPNADTLPQWYVDEYKKKAMFKGYGAQYMRDTAILTAAAYLMGGVEYSLTTLRGKEDPINKTLGGVAAGGMVGYFWFPTRPHARAMMASTGALIGYLGYAAERTAKTVLLEQQKQLEKEVLGMEEEGTKKELDTAYLRELMVMRQKQMADMMQARQQAGQQGLQPSQSQAGHSPQARAAFPGRPGSMAPGGPGGVGAAGSGQLPWEVPGAASQVQERMGRAAREAPGNSRVGQSDAGDATGRGFGDADNVTAEASTGSAAPAQQPQQQAARRGWWGGRSKQGAQQAPATAQSGGAGMAPGLEIREEDDRGFGQVQENMRDGFTIIEESDVPRR